MLIIKTPVGINRSLFLGFDDAKIVLFFQFEKKKAEKINLFFGGWKKMRTFAAELQTKNKHIIP